MAASSLPGDQQQINTNQSLPRCPRLVSHLPPGREAPRAGGRTQDAGALEWRGDDWNMSQRVYW